MLTTNWTDTLDQLVRDAILEGRVTGRLSGQPDRVVESGLAHVFFYGDTVYKLYKTHSDKDHFIKGVLAPTDRRRQFIEHDFTLNRHFSGSVYRDRHSAHYDNGQVRVGTFDAGSIYSLIEMSVLDFDTNLHERLLRDDVSNEELYALGRETARAIATCPIKVPDTVNWYDLATERVGFLRQFIDWLPAEFGEPLQQAGVVNALGRHLECYRDEYRALSGDSLTVNIDNHDENVFFVDGKPQFIDLLPPMSSWWYGLPYANVSNLMANVAVLHSKEAAQRVLDGYSEYNGVELPEHAFGFTQAFAYLISIAHFGTVPGKEAVTRRYLDDILEWLQ